MGKFGFVQTVEDYMKLFSKRQIAGAVRVRDLYEKLIYPSTSDFRAIVSVGGVPGSGVTTEDVKAADVIWGRSVLKMKGNTVRRNGKRMAQSIVKVPKELIKLQQDVELAIDCFFVNKHIFLTTYTSTKICFSTVTHLAHRKKALVWEALHATYKIYLLRGFRIVVIAGDHKFASISDLVVQLPTAPKLDWAAASQHCGLIKRNIRFLKEKIRSLHHSLPFKRVPGIMVVRMVLHIVKFENGFPRRVGIKHYSPCKIMMDCRLNANDLTLNYGIFYKVAENFEPRNSLARTRAIISLGNSGNSLNFPERHGWEIGDHPQDFDPSRDDGNAGRTRHGRNSLDDVELPGVDTDFDAEPTGVEVDSAYVTPKHTEVNGLGQQDPSVAPTEEPSAEPPTAPTVETQAPSEPKKGMAARNAGNRKQPEKYVPSMKRNKYAVAPTEIAALLKGIKHAMSMAQMSVKLMNKGAHRKADVVGMIMAQISMKIEPIRKWGLETEYTITETEEMKQKGAGVASQGTAFAQKQKDLEDKKSVHINKSARRIKSLTNKEKCQNCDKTGHPAECNYNKECQNCG